jgi:hypothetical protein
MIMDIPALVIDFANSAIYQAFRITLLIGETYPVPTHVLVTMRDEMDPVGARVYMESPGKPVWTQPPGAECEGGKLEIGSYENERKKQTPPGAIYYTFEIGDDNTVIVETGRRWQL